LRNRLHAGSRPFEAINVNEENSIRKLTPEIIEACMDRDTAEIIGRTDEDVLAGDVWGEIELFEKYVMASDKIRGELFGIISALYDSQADGATKQSVLMKRFQELVGSGKVTEHQVQLVTQACRTFFFLGWHARGAIEDAEKMNGF
jgi:hypothetical protein